MKTIYLSIISLLLTFNTLAQAPEGINYQAVIRDAAGDVLPNSTIGLKIDILQGGVSGTSVYAESFTELTNNFGLINVVIGNGTVLNGTFSGIDWSNGPYFIEISADENGGTAYSLLGTQQLMSVPYALHSNTADNVINDQVNDADNDPTNEIETWGTLSGIPSDFADDTDDGFTTEGELTTLLDNNYQPFDDVDDADADPTNELQTISISNDTIYLTDGGFAKQASPVVESTGSRSGICSGSTAGGTGWQTYNATTIYIEVNTSGCSYSATPRYITSIGGLGSHFQLVGGTAIYSPTTTSFRVYVSKIDNTALTPSEAASGGWFVNWMGIGD